MMFFPLQSSLILLKHQLGGWSYLLISMSMAPPPATTEARGQFPDIFQPHQTMQQFMWQPNLLQVAKFLDASMKRLQTVDPNEGSDI